MNITTAAPYDWLKTLPPSLFFVDDVPLLGQSAPFPWQGFVELVLQKLELDQLAISPSPWEWRDAENLFTGISELPYLVPIALSGYPGQAIIAFDKQSLLSIVEYILTQQLESNLILDASYENAFLRFLLLSLCEQFSQLSWEKGLQINLLSEAKVEEKPYLCLDLRVSSNVNTFFARVLINEELRQAWKEKHQAPFDVQLNPALAKKIELPVSLEAGYIHLNLSRWKQVSLGDVLLLDICTLDSDLTTGSLLLRVHHLPYYKAEFNQGNIILQEQPSYYEIESVMANKSFSDDDDNDFSFDDSDFDFDDEDSDFDFSEESPSKEVVVEEEEGTEAPPQKAAANQAAASAKQLSAEPQGEAIEVEEQHAQAVASLKDVPLHIAVEVGRFQMNLEKMMELQSGSLIHLQVRPEDGVDLVLNGKRIARGELLRFGENLGVRITEIH